MTIKFEQNEIEQLIRDSLIAKGLCINENHPIIFRDSGVRLTDHGLAAVLVEVS